MPHAPQDPRVKEAYQNLIAQTMAQYRALEDAGYRFYLFGSESDPYDGNPWNAMRDLSENGTMGVYATADGFGSNAEVNVEDNPLLADTGVRWPWGSLDGELRPVLANDLFRAVHDAFGHGLEGAGFRARGEENAWQAHVRLFHGSAVGAITSETRGQNSWLNYGPHAEKNQTAKVFDTTFADQKTGLMPEWTWLEGRAGDMPEPTDPQKKKKPVYTHEVIDPRDGNKVMGQYQSATAARRGQDRFDNKYGGYRYKVREIGGGDVKLSARKATTDAYEARIDALFGGGAANRNGVKILDRCDILGLLGYGEGAVYLAEGKVVAGMSNHPHMKAAQWKKVPAWLDAPAAVFDSDTVQGRLVVVAPETVDGAPVMMILEPHATLGSNALQLNMLVNAYDAKGGRTPFMRWILEGLARYVDQKKFPAVLEQAGLRLPSTATKNKPGTKRILSEKDLAGYTRTHPLGDVQLSARDGAWDAGKSTRLDDVIYKMQDKQIDTKRVIEAIEAIEAAGKAVDEEHNPYLQEELFNGRAAKRVEAFASGELKPLMQATTCWRPLEAGSTAPGLGLR